MVQTPGRSRKSRLSASPNNPVESDASNVLLDASIGRVSTKVNGHTIRSANGNSNSHANGKVEKRPVDEADPRVDAGEHMEFGGSFGVGAMMLGFPALMWYMWIGATYYDGHLPLPEKGESLLEFGRKMAHFVYTGAFPSLKAWTIYWTFFLSEAAGYVLLPGITAKGKPLAHEGGKQLLYYCSGIWSFYATIVVMGVLHFTGLFPLYTLLDEFGPLMSVAIISGYIVSIIAYVSAWYRRAQHRMTGYLLYDFFMGAELNPRMFGILDFKMFFEVRIPWFILFLLSSSAAARQYEQFGWVSGEVAFLVVAHFLYANACSKGEECIATTW